MKVVFHIDEKTKFKLTWMNVENILTENSEVKVSVVINSEAVELFTNKEIKLLSNVDYYICNNALNFRKVNKNDLIAGLKIINSGVYQVALLQEEGYFYIKP